MNKRVGIIIFCGLIALKSTPLNAEQVSPAPVKEEAVATEKETPQPAEEQAGEPIKVLILDPKILKIDEQTAKLITSFITAELSQYKTLEIISGEDMRRMMELEAEKQTVGCNDNDNCLAELAGALGADLVVYGELGKLGNQYMLQQSLFNTKAGKAIARISVQSESIDVIPNQLRPKLRYLVKDFIPKEIAAAAQETGVSPTSPASPPTGKNKKSKSLPLSSWIAYGTSGLTLIAGSALTVLGTQSFQDFQTKEERVNEFVADPTLASPSQRSQALKAKNDAQAQWESTGQTFLFGGIASITVGLIAGVAGLWFQQEAAEE